MKTLRRYPPDHFINRELSLLAFNRRVIAQAADPATPAVLQHTQELRLDLPAGTAAAPGLFARAVSCVQICLLLTGRTRAPGRSSTDRG